MYHNLYAHLPCQDSEGIDIACLRGSCGAQSEVFMVSQFGSGAMEKPVNVYSVHVRWKKGDSKTSNVGMPTSINENVCLGECEGVILKR